MGDAADLAARYRDQGADELVFYDITASPEGRTLDYGWVREIARLLDIPFCVAGGIRTVDQAAACLDNGADKVSINSPALERPELITEMAERLGSQCVVVGVDSRREDGDYVVHKYTGDPDARRLAGRRTMDWIVEAQERGAGEIVLYRSLVGLAMMTVVLLVSGTQFLILGVLGEYVGRAFLSANGKPQGVVRDVVVSGAPGGSLSKPPAAVPADGPPVFVADAVPMEQPR
jgi:hypothetical protein